MLPRGMLPAGVDGARSTPTRAQLSLANHVAASFKQLGGGPLVDEDGGVAATRERRNYPATFPTHKRERERERERKRKRDDSQCSSATRSRLDSSNAAGVVTFVIIALTSEGPPRGENKRDASECINGRVLGLARRGSILKGIAGSRGHRRGPRIAKRAVTPRKVCFAQGEECPRRGRSAARLHLERGFFPRRRTTNPFSHERLFLREQNVRAKPA